MLKKYNVKVNGKSYEVEVEEISSGASVKQETVINNAPVKETPVITETVKQEPVVKKEEIKPVSGGAQVLSPLPGVVIDISVTVGQSVKKGDKLLVIEAMKMENEIPCETAGTIAEILVKKGDTVDGDQVLMTIK